MDPFTQRMLDRARARQEKIDQKLASSGQPVPKRKPLSENITNSKTATPTKTPDKSRKSMTPKNQKETAIKSPEKTIVSILMMDRENSDVSSEKTERTALRHNMKSRLDRLGVLYSDKADLSSPIHRTEQEFSSATPPATEFEKMTPKPRPQNDGKKKFGRLAALADQINNWEDDLTHHTAHTEETTSHKTEKADTTSSTTSSSIDVSIHSLNDINKVLKDKKTEQSSKSINTRTFTKPETQLLHNKVVAELEGEGYRRATADQSRLVYDFSTTQPERARQEPSGTTPSAAATPEMAAVVAATPPTIAKKPSIKKYKAPTPPLKDKENNVVQDKNENDAADNAPKPDDCRSPIKKYGNADRSSVLSKAAMFEAGSPRARDPAEMSLRERKALFEKNKGVAIVPKAPFGQAPSVKSLQGNNNKADSKPTKPILHTAPTKSNGSSRTNSKENIPDDNVSQTSVGGIKGKLAALFSKEQTISETTIANKFKQEREKEMEMLQNRFHYKSKSEVTKESEDCPSDQEDQEDAPLMGSTVSLTAAKKPEIISHIPKVTFEKTKSETALDGKPDVVAAQPTKRRSSSTQDSPVVLSVLEDVKRIKVNNKKELTNGVTQPSLYPHLSDIETDTSHTQEEYSDCGGSSRENLNKSDNWAETSFGREIMNVVKKNNSSYQKAVRDSSDSSDGDGEVDSDLDGLLDEALNEESEGPTPPKVNKNGNVLSSKSFTYESHTPDKKQFKSPLKTQPTTPHIDRGNELVHSVSFYRRMQNASQGSTPHRVVRHGSPDRTPEPSSAPAAVTVRRRIKDLQQEINKQQTVISQASQALNLCAATVEFSGSTEQAEGERLLLLASHRRQACVHEAQRLQVEGAGTAAAAGGATLTLTSLTAPLRREYVRNINAEGAVGHYAVCLFKCRDRVLATSMQQTLPTSPTIHFPDEIRMEGLNADFKVTIEVYLLQASKEHLPHDVKYHISKKTKANTKLLTPKSKCNTGVLKTPKVQSPGGPLTVRTPQFQLHGYCIFALPQATRRTFTLNKVPCGSPLEGSINLNIKASIRVPPPGEHAAFLTAFDDVSGLGAWHRRWFLLKAPRLSYWKYPDDVNKKMPIGDIDLTTVTSERVTKAPRDLCARPNTLLLESSVPAGLIVPDSDSLVYFKKQDGTVVRRHLLAADTPHDRDIWLETLNKALEYVRCCETEDE